MHSQQQCPCFTDVLFHLHNQAHWRLKCNLEPQKDFPDIYFLPDSEQYTGETIFSPSLAIVKSVDLIGYGKLIRFRAEKQNAIFLRSAGGLQDEMQTLTKSDFCTKSHPSLQSEVYLWPGKLLVTIFYAWLTCISGNSRQNVLKERKWISWRSLLVTSLPSLRRSCAV